MADVSFQTQLLAETLRFVLDRVPYYRQRAGLCASRPRLALDEFPIIDAALVRSRFNDFIAFDRFPDFVLTSGGTMAGTGNISYRLVEEYEAVHQYLTGADRRGAGVPDGFGIDVFTNSNGYSQRKPPGWPLVCLALEQQTHAGMIERWLRSGLWVAGQHLVARHLQAQSGAMRALTGFFEAQGFCAADHSLGSVVSYGAHLTAAWRNRIEALWGVSPKTIYGLSEFSPGNAVECDDCGSYHFWTCWPEYIGFHGEAVLHGDARLVLTSLLPFVRLQPRVRYFTGDIVTVTGFCPAAGQPGFRFRGREQSTVVAKAGAEAEVLLSEIDVLEVVEAMPDICCEEQLAVKRLWLDGAARPSGLGYPRIQLEPGIDSGAVLLRVEAIFDPADQPGRAAGLRDDILSGLHAILPSLGEALARNNCELRVELRAPHSLSFRQKGIA